MLHIRSFHVSLYEDCPFCILTRADQGQGGGIAIEDGTTLSVVLPLGTKPEEIAERLALYEKIRYERANNIQEYSRQAGNDCVDGKPTIDSSSILLSFPILYSCHFPYYTPVISHIVLLITNSDEIHGVQFRP
jgi:hypothetical protein